MKRKRISVTIKKDFLKPINDLIKNAGYPSRSSLIEEGLRLTLNLKGKRSVNEFPTRKIEREKICISLSPDLVKEVNYRIMIGTFTSFSHAIDVSLRKVLESYGYGLKERC